MGIYTVVYIWKLYMLDHYHHTDCVFLEWNTIALTHNSSIIGQNSKITSDLLPKLIALQQWIYMETTVNIKTTNWNVFNKLFENSSLFLIQIESEV